MENYKSRIKYLEYLMEREKEVNKFSENPKNKDNINFLNDFAELLNLKGSISILYTLYTLNSKVRFIDIQRLCEVSLGSLNKSLLKLIENGLIDKNKTRKTANYFLTEKGKKLCQETIIKIVN